MKIVLDIPSIVPKSGILSLLLPLVYVIPKVSPPILIGATVLQIGMYLYRKGKEMETVDGGKCIHCSSSIQQG